MGHGQIAGGYGDMSHILSIYGIYGFWVKGILLHLYWGKITDEYKTIEIYGCWASTEYTQPGTTKTNQTFQVLFF